jgi:hypothetical protein
LKITINQLKRIIREEVSKMNTINEARSTRPHVEPIPAAKANKYKDTKDALVLYPLMPQDEGHQIGPLDDLLQLLQVSKINDVEFARAKTPVGSRLLAGVKGTKHLTVFWDADDGWQPIPEEAQQFYLP